MPNIVVTRDFFSALRKLPIGVQNKFDDFLGRFQENPHDGSIQLHKLSDRMADPRVRGARLDQKYRVIVLAPDQGDTYLMVHVGNHDEAYSWAERKRFEIHPRIGTLQIFDTELVEETARNAVHSGVHESGPAAVPLLLDRFSDDDLFQAGVPKALIPAVRVLRDEDQLAAVLPFLPDECASILIDLAGGSSLDEALENNLLHHPAAANVATQSFDDLELQSGSNVFRVDDPALGKKIAEQDLEAWRLFLHPTQLALAHAPLSGAQVLINGAAGTGKTVVLLHRAAFILAERPDDSILFLTYSGTLALEIRAQLRRLAGAAARRVEVSSIYHFARRKLQAVQGGLEIVRSSDRKWIGLWKENWEALGRNWPLGEQEAQREYIEVVEVNGIATLDDYLTVVRKGRVRLSRQQRTALWELFVAFRERLRVSGLMPAEDSLRAIREFFDAHASERYAHVLADEIQDMALEGLRFVRAAWNSQLPHGSLTLAGDGHQRLYLGGVPLVRAGIEARGRRSRRLRINYRTTEEIRTFAHGLMEGMEIDDLNGGPAGVFGDLSMLHGPVPQQLMCADPREEAANVLSCVRGLLSDGFADSSICVTALTPTYGRILKGLEDAGIVVLELQAATEDNPRQPGVRIGTVARIKGLEFRAVILSCVVDRHPIDDLEKADRLDRCAIYVACTRARERLTLTRTGVPPNAE